MFVYWSGTLSLTSFWANANKILIQMRYHRGGNYLFQEERND